MIPVPPSPYDDHTPEKAPQQASVPVPALKEPLFPKGQKPPLVFSGVILPNATDADQAWKKKFDKYADQKKDRKCASMLKKALEEDQFWRIAYALETRHQDPDPNSVFAYGSKVSPAWTSGYRYIHGLDNTLAEAIKRPCVSFTAEKMMREGLQPKHDHVVGFNTLLCCHRDTLMTWAEHADQNVLDTILLVMICTEEAKDITKLCNMGADINCTHTRLNNCNDKYSLYSFDSVYDFKTINANFSTPLRCAISMGNNTILKQVIDLGANTSIGFDLLMCQAYKYGNLDIVQTLKEAHEAQEKTVSPQSQTLTNSTDGWTALSATFAEFSRPKGPTGLQVTYQVDFEAQLVNCVYEKDNTLSAPAVIPLSQLDNPELLQKAADVIQKNGYPRPHIQRTLSTPANPTAIKTISTAVPPRPQR